jgi:hypothetical protein
MIIDDPQEILSWDTKKLWAAINMIDNKEEYEEELSIIKYGIKIQVPIWYIIEEWFEMYPSSARIKIMGYGKYKIWDFMQEKEERESIMRRVLIDNMEDEGPTEART